jgi:uncharacterized protein Usg
MQKYSRVRTRVSGFKRLMTTAKFRFRLFDHKPSRQTESWRHKDMIHEPYALTTIASIVVKG